MNDTVEGTDTHSARRTIGWLIFLVPFLMGLGVDLYVPSLPALSGYYQSGAGPVQLTISLYMFGYGVGQLALGTLSDTLGRRKVMLGGSLVYGIISILSVGSPHISILILCRFIQGLGVGGMAAVGRALIVDSFQGDALAKATNSFGISWALGPIIGPFLGGYFEHYLSWKADFYFFALYGLAIFMLAWFKMPETNPHLIRFSLKGTCTIMASIVSHPVFICMTAIGGLGYAAVILFNTMAPFLVQDVLGFSAVDYGYMALALGIAYFAGSVGNRFGVGRHPLMSVLLFGLTGALAASLVMLGLGVFVGVRLPAIMTPVLLITCLCGFIVPNTLARSMALFRNHAGAASSLFGSLSGIVVSGATSVASAVTIRTQLPLAVFYFSLMLLSLALFLVCKGLEKRRELARNKGFKTSRAHPGHPVMADRHPAGKP